MSAIDTGIIYFYLALMIVIGLYASLKQDSVEDYFVAGRRLGPFSIACLWLASWVGGASIIGSSGKAYEFGVSGVWYITGIALGCLAFGTMFAARLKNMGDQHKHLTYPDLIEERFDSRTRIVATITTAAAYIAYSAGQLAAAGSVIHVLLGWDFGPSLFLAASIVIAYTATGGFLAVTYTDWVQFILLFLGIVVVGVPIAMTHTGSASEMLSRLPESYKDLGTWGWSTIIALTVAMVFSFFTAMDNFTRCFAAKDAKSARNGTLLAIIFLAPIAIAATWLGMSAAIMFPGIENSADVLPTFVIELFPVGFKGLVLVGILAALMSSADICILTTSANITRDIYQRFINPDISKKSMLRMSMYTSIASGALAALLAWQMQDIVDILLLGFTVNSAALFIPTIAAVYWRKVAPTAAFWSISLSLTVVVLWHFAGQMELAEIFAIEPLWPGLLVSILTFFWASTRNKPVVANPAT